MFVLICKPAPRQLQALRHHSLAGGKKDPKSSSHEPPASREARRLNLGSHALTRSNVFRTASADPSLRLHLVAVHTA